MIFSILFIINALHITAEHSSDTGYCDIKNKNCNENNEYDNRKYLFYDVNPPEGFNLRRDVYMRFAIMLTEAKKKGKANNWNLVLPPFYNLYHWKSTNPKPIFWNRFFDTNFLKSYAQVLEMYEVIHDISPKPLQIDTHYVLQNYEDPFEDGNFVDKWETSECVYESQFWGYKNITVKETVCVKYQGKISMLLEVLNLHPFDKKVMFSHGEIPLHDAYGTKSYWDCRKSMKFNNKLIKRASNYIAKELHCYEEKCSTYIAVHWRRQDFARSRSNDVPTISGTAKQIDKAILKKKLKVKNIFIATDSNSKDLRELERKLLEFGYNMLIYLPDKKDMAYGDGGIAIIDQIICSRALYFIGTHESTFTYRIQEEREILGFDSSTTFNRFCPDTGHCERPSKWTIVH